MELSSLSLFSYLRREPLFARRCAEDNLSSAPVIVVHLKAIKLKRNCRLSAKVYGFHSRELSLASKSGEVVIGAVVVVVVTSQLRLSGEEGKWRTLGDR